MRHNHIEDANIDIYYPNTICFSRGQSTYVRVDTNKNKINEDVVLNVYYGGNNINISRKTNAAGTAIFPLSSILDSFASNDNIRVLFSVGLRLTYGDIRPYNAIYTVIIGHSDTELEAVTNQAQPNNTPASRKIVVYPSFGETQFVFVPDLLDTEVTLKTSWGWLIYDAVPNQTPFVSFDPKSVEWHDDKYLSIIVSSDVVRSFEQRIDLDYCTDGLFVKWVDKNGIPYIYRWSIESSVDEVSSDSTYTKLDDLLNPYEVNSKTLTRRRVLHSRMVDQDVFGLCKSIISGQDIQYYDAKADKWRRAVVEEGEATDDGAVLKDLTIEIVDKTYNL